MMKNEATTARPKRPRMPDWRKTADAPPPSQIPVDVVVPLVYPDLEFTPQEYLVTPKPLGPVPGAKNVSIVCFSYKLLAHVLINEDTTWNDMRGLVLQRLQLNTSGNVKDPFGILDVALAGIPITVRGRIGCQDPCVGKPFDLIPENGMVYIQQIRRAPGWVPLMGGMSLIPE